MNYNAIKSMLIVFFTLAVLMNGCGGSDSAGSDAVKKNDPRLMGTWRQTSIGRKQVTDIVVKLRFTEDKMTMNADGCIIIGDYSTQDDKIITYTVTAIQGERCAASQKPGVSDRISYHVTDSQLSLSPVSGGEESRTTYRRVDS